MKNELEVVQQRSVERGRPVLKQLKTEYSDRVVTFGDVTAAVPKRHRALQQAEAEFVGPAWRETGLVFTTPLGGWIDPNNFGRTMDALVDKARVPASRRRGCATRRSRSAGSWSATTR